MPSSYSLGPHFEAFIQSQLATGRYGNASEVIRDALRQMEEREKQYAALDAKLTKAIAEVEAGEFYDANEVFDELEARYAAMEKAQNTA